MNGRAAGIAYLRRRTVSEILSPEQLEEYIDVKEGMGRVRGNKALYKRMLDMFLNSKEVGEFDSFLKEKNCEEASKSAHAIKGISGNLSLKKLFNVSNDLVEELRKEIINEEAIAGYYDTLEKTRAAVVQTISEL